MKEKDIQIGDIINKIEILEIIKEKNQRTKVKIKCFCNSIKTILLKSIVNGNTKSCGCAAKTKAKENIIKRCTIHGLSKSKLYAIYNCIINRCYNNKNKDFNNYGNRGITVCDEWRYDFKKFYDWAMTNGYEKGLTIDRINNNGNYEPNNCRWITMKQQSFNRRTNRLVTIEGETKCLKEWLKDKRCSIKYCTLQARLYTYHWDIKRAILTPSRYSTSLKDKTEKPT